MRAVKALLLCAALTSSASAATLGIKSPLPNNGTTSASSQPVGTPWTSNLGLSGSSEPSLSPSQAISPSVSNNDSPLPSSISGSSAPQFSSITPSQDASGSSGLSGTDNSPAAPVTSSPLTSSSFTTSYRTSTGGNSSSSSPSTTSTWTTITGSASYSSAPSGFNERTYGSGGSAVFNSSSPAITQPPVTVTVECPIDGSPCNTVNATITADDDPPEVTVTTSCTPLYSGDTMYVYSVVYEATVTFSGDPSAYSAMQAAFATPALATPHYCSHMPPEPVSPPDQNNQGPNSTIINHPYKTERPPFGTPGVTETGTSSTEASNNAGSGGGAGEPATSGDLVAPPAESTAPSYVLPVVTHVTTVRSTTTVLGSYTPPNYQPSNTDKGGLPTAIVHQSVGGGGGSGKGGGGPVPDADTRPRPTFHVTAGPTSVVINGQTFGGLRPGQTSVVSVEGMAFTILPTAVVGAGGSVSKPAPPPTAIAAPTPTSGQLDGMDVSVAGSVAVIDGVTVTIPPQGTTTEIHGIPVTINGASLMAGGSLFTFDPSSSGTQPNVLVEGGELMTVIGRSVMVLHQTTITYGPAVANITTTVNEDTITVEPPGVSVHGKLLGGPHAGVSETRFEMVGGATVTRIAPSIAVINGHTFTVGPGSQETTTQIGGQMFEIGPSGVVVSSVTMTYPFGAAAVTTSIVPSGTWTDALPAQTGGTTNEEDSAAGSLRPALFGAWAGFCIAIGVFFLP